MPRVEERYPPQSTQEKEKHTGFIDGQRHEAVVDDRRAIQRIHRIARRQVEYRAAGREADRVAKKKMFMVAPTTLMRWA